MISYLRNIYLNILPRKPPDSCDKNFYYQSIGVETNENTSVIYRDWRLPLQQLELRLRMSRVRCEGLFSSAEGETNCTWKSTLENGIVCVIFGGKNDLPNVVSEAQGESVVDGLANIFFPSN